MSRFAKPLQSFYEASLARSLAKTRSCAPKCTCSFGQSRPPCLIYLLDRRTNGELLLKCLSSEQVAFHQKRRQKRPCSPVRTRLGQAEAKPDILLASYL
ncbi:hypothetical protein pipiens_010751 [Culex pipiens pipiens]|uniref:Uncharacterized protein n=1 Tax=Culex pipiens pipiens TaxID=38569 RepID=A0ABD1D8Y9_CULPP